MTEKELFLKNYSGMFLPERAWLLHKRDEAIDKVRVMSYITKGWKIPNRLKAYIPEEHRHLAITQ